MAMGKGVLGQLLAGRDRIRALGRGVREVRQADEILRKASACSAAAELDRPLRR